MRKGVVLWVFVTLLLSLTCAVWTGKGLAADPEPTGPEDLVKRIMEAQEKLAAVDRRIGKEALLAEQAPPEDSVARSQVVTKLQEIKFIYQRLLNALKKSTTVAAEEAELKKGIETGQAYALAEKKPYSLGFYDGLLDRLAAVRQEKEMSSTAVQAAEMEREERKKELEKAEQTWRRVKEEVEAERGAEAENDLGYIRAQLELEGAKAAFDLQEVRHDTLKKEMSVIDLKETVAARKLAAIRDDLSFDPASLEQEIARLGKRKAQLDGRIQSILDGQKQVDREWDRDRRTGATPPSGSVASAAMQAKEAWQQTYEESLQQIEDIAQSLSTQEKLWRSRYALLQGDASKTQLDLWEEEAKAAGQQAQQAIRLYQSSQANLQSHIASLEKETVQRGGNVEEQKYLTRQLEALRKRSELGGEYLATLLGTDQLASRLLGEIAARGEQDSIWEKAVSKGGTRFRDFWNFELWVIDDQGVTVRKVVTALIILVIGILLVKRAIRLVGTRFLKRTRLEVSASAAVEKLLFYLGLLLVVLFALRMVNIPLTAFTFLGGAIAIGVGFGAQNLINNFISGFIIMAERPIRIGDLIEVEGTFAKVEEIGARCTRITTGQNIDILVPNSSFLEKNIKNWTLTDKLARTQVVVGVAYGSPVKRVTELLLQAADEGDKILKEPKPFVIFEDFGDNALIFEVHFWVIVLGVTETRRISSAVRYRIDELFAKDGIVIAFPQRDIHVDSLRPLQVELLEGTRGSK